MNRWLRCCRMLSVLCCGVFCGWILAAGAPAEAAGAVIEYAHPVDAADAEAGGGVDSGVDSAALARAGLRIDVDGGDVLVAFLAPNGGEEDRYLSRRLLYLAEHRLLVILHDDRQTFSQVDREVLAVLDRHLDQQDTDRRLRLIQLPDRPRQVMADVLAKEDAARAARPAWTPWQLASSGEWAEREGYRSLEYEVAQGGAPLGTLWVTEVDQTPIEEAQVTAVRDASRVLDELLVAASQMRLADSRSVLGFDFNPLAAFAFQRGVPVVQPAAGVAAAKYEKILTLIRVRQPDDGPVAIPAGYRPETLGPQ